MSDQDIAPMIIEMKCEFKGLVDAQKCWTMQRSQWRDQF